MVYYIIACHKDGQSEEQTAAMVTQQALKDGARNLGEAYELTKEKVSNLDLGVINVFCICVI